MSRKTALICDDDRMMTRITKLVLVQRGFSVIEATDGEAGLALIKSERPAVVLLDLNMPKMDGIDVLKALQADAYTGSYIIVFSADDKAAIEARIAGLGAGEAMVKPFVPAELSKRIEALVRDGRV